MRSRSRFCPWGFAPRLLFLSLPLLSGILFPSHADTGGLSDLPPSFVQGRNVSTRLVATSGHPENGIFHVGVLFEVRQGWHTYWVNPGSTGMPSTIKLSLPDGWKQGRSWHPAPVRYENEGLVDYIHEGRFMVVTEVIPDDPHWVRNLESAVVVADVEWLECALVCMPGSSRLGIETGKAGNVVDREDPDLAGMIRQVVGAYEAALAGTWWEQAGNLHFRIPPGPDSGLSSGTVWAYWFNESAANDPGAPQTVSVHEDGGVVLSVIKNPVVSERMAMQEGFVLLRSADGNEYSRRAVFVHHSGPAIAGSDSSRIATSGSFLRYLMFAFLGGLVLNLMPCVFPVIGLKVLGFVEQAGQDRKKVISHGITFTAGVLVSFWILALVLLLLRSGGDQLGWGFQLQEPAFNYALIVLLLSFGLSLSGVFEFGMSAIGVGQKLASGSGLRGSFFSGVLATLVATPCSAPFLAPALGAALAMPPVQAFVLFNAIALGLSTPYLALSFSPGLISRMPRPGAWMESFKQFMAFLLYATVAYLLWALLGQVDASGQLNVLISLVLVALSWWIWGRWGAPYRTLLSRRLAWAMTFAVLVLAVWLGYPRTDTKSFWEPWSPETLERHLQAGNPVYVDFTARWCATCLVNKRVVFSSEEVLATFREHQVVALVADWTNRDDRITRELERYGRAAVPFNLVYRKGEREPVILPELLTPGIVIDAVTGR
jgi:thiol:disulfide interchange protein